LKHFVKRTVATDRVPNDDDRLCIECDELKPDTDFIARIHRSNGRQYRDSRCDQCRRIANICHNLAIEPSRYAELIHASKGQCAVCRRKFDSEVKPCIDHCHLTGKLRGVLCVACNVALGYFRDDVPTIHRALAYLKRWQSVHERVEATDEDAKREENMALIRKRKKSKTLGGRRSN
jgi:hypothetical protein